MICPYCNNKNTKVVDKRDSETEASSRRRRECLKCKRRFTTYERVEALFFKIRKKDGSLENYDREKILGGIATAAEKRGVSVEQIEDLVLDIEEKIFLRSGDEVSSSDIGRMVLSGLKKIDKVAYLRFASMFLDFAGIEDFKEEIKKIS